MSATPEELARMQEEAKRRATIHAIRETHRKAVAGCKTDDERYDAIKNKLQADIVWSMTHTPQP